MQKGPMSFLFYPFFSGGTIFFSSLKKTPGLIRVFSEQLF